MILLLLVFSIPVVYAESSNTGIVYWKQEIVSPNSFVDIYVQDDDMNKKEYPNFADKFTINVWSDSSPEGLEIKVVETGVYSGIFKGSVYVANSGNTENNRLVSMPGDILYAKYFDSITSDGNSSEIISVAIVKVSNQNMDELLNKIDPKLRSQKSSDKQVPMWVKNNAGWWSDGTISESEFLSAISFLIKDEIIKVPINNVSSKSSDSVPDWVKNNAGWWADGTISDGEFVNAIQYLIKSGFLSVSTISDFEDKHIEKSTNNDSTLAAFEAELEKCSEIVKAYKRIDCEKPIDKEIMLYKYKTDAESFDIGPITYYWFGVGSEGNEFEITSSGQAILSVRMLAENTSSEVTAIHCTSPSICAYDVWDGSKAFKYSGMDFTSGQIVLNPGDTREFNILFGPNIGYGGTEFEYDSSKSYTFRINEDFGSANIPLKLE